MSESFIIENTESRFLIEEESTENDEISFELEYNENASSNLEFIDISSKSSRKSCFYVKKDFIYKEMIYPLKKDFICKINVNNKWRNIENIITDQIILEEKSEKTPIQFITDDVFSNTNEISNYVKNSSSNKVLVIQAQNDLNILTMSPKVLEKKSVSIGTQTENVNIFKKDRVIKTFVKDPGINLNRRKTTDFDKYSNRCEIPIFMNKNIKIEGRTHKKTFIPSPGFSPIKYLDLCQSKYEKSIKEECSKCISKKRGKMLINRDNEEKALNEMQKLKRNLLQFKKISSSNNVDDLF
jgi:hypothetical protein